MHHEVLDAIDFVCLQANMKLSYWYAVGIAIVHNGDSLYVLVTGR